MSLLVLFNQPASGGGVLATLSVTESSDTVAALMGVPVGASLAVGESSDTSSGQATVLVGATGSLGELGDTLSATGSITSSGVTATLAVSEASDTVSGSTSVVVAGTGSLSELGDTVSAQASVFIAAQLAAVESGDTLAGSATVLASSYTISATRANLIYEIALLHGLVPGSPLVVSPTTRSAGALVQTIAGTDTVTMTTVSSDILSGDLDTWIDALAAVHGLTSPLVVTPTSRSAGALNQTLSNDGTTTTVTAV